MPGKTVKNITIIDVAKRAGVSQATVSAVMNAKTNVRPRTRDLVLKVMKEFNYRPMGVARNLKKGELQKSIGIIVRDLNAPFYTSIASGVKDYASEKGYSVFMTSSDDNHEREKNLLHLYSSNNIDGTIIAPVLGGASGIEHLFELKMFNHPFVLLEDVKGIRANVVAIDNTEALRQVVKYLIRCGHTKIVHFAGSPHSSQTSDKIEGFKLAFSESTLVFHNDMIVSIGSRYEESFEKTIKYFNGRSRNNYPTAIVCYDDIQAFGTMNALREMDIPVPDGISVVGHDDIFYARHCPIPLTTVRMPLNEMGRKAAEILIRNIESTRVEREERVILTTDLVVRQSTKKMECDK